MCVQSYPVLLHIKIFIILVTTSRFFNRRRQRLAEMRDQQQQAKYGDVREISAVDYVDQVNRAGEHVWVVLHLYKSGYPFHDSSI